MLDQKTQTNAEKQPVNSAASSLATSVFVGGSIGAFEALMTHPLMTLKTRCQYDGRPVIADKKSIGAFIKLLYRGVCANVFGMAVIIGVRSLIENCILQHGFKTDDPSFAQGTISACAGGAGSALLTTPMELGVTLQQTRTTAASYLSTLKAVILKFGFRGIFTGFFFTALRSGIVTAGFLTFAPELKEIIREKTDLGENGASVVAGTTAGAGCAFITHPLGTIKTVQQANVIVHSGKSSSIQHAITHIFSRHGFLGFYRGLFWRSLKVIPHIAIIAGLFEIAEKALQSWNNKKPQNQSLRENGKYIGFFKPSETGQNLDDSNASLATASQCDAQKNSAGFVTGMPSLS